MNSNQPTRDDSISDDFFNHFYFHRVILPVSLKISPLTSLFQCVSFVMYMKRVIQRFVVDCIDMYGIELLIQTEEMSFDEIVVSFHDNYDDDDNRKLV
jgi:hypothetical protein